jgi:predicted phosphodiesterase
MGKRFKKRKCPACGKEKTFRTDVKTCGCKGSNPFAKEKPVETPKPKMVESIEKTDNTLAINLPSTNIHTLDQLIAKFEVDTEIWEVERFVANKWEVVMKAPAYTELFDITHSSEEGSVTNTLPMWQRDKDKLEPLREPLYQVKAFFRRKANVQTAKEQIAELKELAKEYAPKPPKIDRTFTPSTGNLLVINLSDHHFGKLAWGYETGKQNYDVSIATEVFNRAFETILKRASAFEFEEIWFVVGNDLLNSDDKSGRTTKGTVVSTDIRYTRTMTIVRNVLIGCIEKLRHFTPKVKVKMVSGNHDEFSVWHIGSSLECFFNKYTDVLIDNEPKYQKFDEFGKVMIMWTHGDKGKRKDYPLLMATMQPKMFGRTKFHEIHTGHLHHERVMEHHGIKVRVLSSLSPSDRWHAENGYMGALRQSEAFIYNKEQGLVSTIIYVDNDDLMDGGNPGPTKLPKE